MALTAVPLLFVLVGTDALHRPGRRRLRRRHLADHRHTNPEGRRIRDFAHNVMAPVWEANHVWLIFVLTVTWTAYPAAFGSIASTLSIALILAALGIVIRGAAYAVSAGATGPRQVRDVDVVSAISSILTPFALGACLGGIASGRVPYGKAKGTCSRAGSTRPRSSPARWRSRSPPTWPLSTSATMRSAAESTPSSLPIAVARSAPARSPACSPQPGSWSCIATPIPCITS